jgi:integrase
MAVYSYKRSDGSKWYGVEKSHRGHRIHKQGFRSKRAAEAFERKKIDEIDLGLSGKTVEITFKEYVDWWLNRRGYLKPSTLRTYRSVLKNYTDEIGYMTLGEITATMLAELVSRAGEPKTQLNHIALLRVFFKDAITYGFLLDSPAEKVNRPKIQKKEMHFLSPEECTRLIQATNGRTKAIIELALLTGMRRGEIFGLKWGDLKGEYIEVRRSRYGGRDVSPKSPHSIRRIPLALSLKKDLQSLDDGCSDYIFNFNADNFVKRQFKPALKKAGVRRIRFHDLRHTFAALMISRGANPKFLQEVMGHESFSTTMNMYGHLYPTEHREVIESLTDLLPQESHN